MEITRNRKSNKVQISKRAGRGVGLDHVDGGRRTASEGKHFDREAAQRPFAGRRVLAPAPALPQGVRGLGLLSVED